MKCGTIADIQPTLSNFMEAWNITENCGVASYRLYLHYILHTAFHYYGKCTQVFPGRQILLFAYSRQLDAMDVYKAFIRRRAPNSHSE